MPRRTASIATCESTPIAQQSSGRATTLPNTNTSRTASCTSMPAALPTRSRVAASSVVTGWRSICR
jgi:hypothetical protein